MEIDLASRSGRALTGVLRGDTDPLSVLFGDGDGASVYADPPFARMLNTMVVAALKGCHLIAAWSCAARARDRRRARCDIRAPSAGVVPADRIQFTFTDISPAFIDAAAARFGGGLARCELLDIERPPEAQGFAAAAYDVVIAANVLHATKDLRASLKHAARLLASSGVLILLEASKRSNWSDLVFGLTPGWWRFADTDVRASHPLLSAARWRDVLLERFGHSVRSSIRPAAARKSSPSPRRRSPSERPWSGRHRLD